jgi:hypothetical protein
MKLAVPYFGRFLSKLFLEIIPGALVSVLAAYLLSMLHLAQGAEPATPSQSVSVLQNDGLSADERRELTRQMLKDRRENPEEPAEVKPVPSLRPAALPSETAVLSSVPHDHVAAPPATSESKLHAEPRPSSVATIAPPPTTPLPRAPAPRVKTEAAAQAPALPPPAVAPTAAAPAAPTATASLPPPIIVAPAAVPPQGATTPLPQVTVNAPANAPAGDLAREPQQRGIVGNIFSGVSTIAGGAANITGNTVNWVIDLPGKAISAGGKAISAGGKLLTGDDAKSVAAPGPAAPGSAGAGNAGTGNTGASGSSGAAPAAAPTPTPLPMIDPQRRNFL